MWVPICFVAAPSRPKLEDVPVPREVSLAGAMLFIVRLPALRKAARPMLERAGVLPQIATGLESTEIGARARG